MQKISYAGYRFPPEIIQQAIWLYLRFTLSLRDVEELLAECGVAVLRDRSALGEPFRTNDRGGAVTLPCEKRKRSTPYAFSSRRDGLAPRGHRRGA